jgi:hypothetical protein
MALCGALLAAFIAPRTDLRADLRLHQFLQQPAHALPQHIASPLRSTSNSVIVPSAIVCLLPALGVATFWKAHGGCLRQPPHLHHVQGLYRRGGGVARAEAVPGWRAGVSEA